MESAPLLTSGDVDLVRIGSARVAVFAGISALHGTVVSWEDPLFTVRFDDGATILPNAKDIVESLVFDPAEVCDPTRFYYGFERFHPASVEGWRLGMLLVLRAEGLEIPPRLDRRRRRRRGRKRERGVWGFGAGPRRLS